MTHRSAPHLAVLIAALLLVAVPAGAAERGARFALVLGVNDPAEPSQPALRYADDDAARTFDLFRGLGASVRLLARPDENTRRLHPQAAAEAAPPTVQSLAGAVGQIAADVWLAHERGVATELYVVYAGHGSVDPEGVAGLTLEDGRVTVAGLADLVDDIAADRTHVIVDACDAWEFAYAGARGPGGERREVHGFSHGGRLADRADTGLLLGASATRETHEWEAVQAGVFSHVVRSGLYGAADADGDGRVDYREIAAFVDRAGQAIPNERYRPVVHVRPPAGEGVLLDLNDGLARRVEFDGERTFGRFLVEDDLGVRLVDFHSAEGQPVHLVRPPGAGRLFLRDVGGLREWTLPAGQAVVQVGDLAPERPRTEARGAAHEAFQQLFALPFDRGVVDTWVPAALEADERAALGPNRLSLGYELRSGALAGSDLVHGVRLGYERAFGRWRPRVGLGYATSRYRYEDALDVTAHEVSLAGGLDVLLWGGGAWELLAGLEAGGGWSVQLAGGATGRQRRSGGLFRWRGGLGVAWSPLPAVAIVVRGWAGQVVLDAQDGVRSPFEATLGAGVEWRL